MKRPGVYLRVRHAMEDDAESAEGHTEVVYATMLAACAYYLAHVGDGVAQLAQLGGRATIRALQALREPVVRQVPKGRN